MTRESKGGGWSGTCEGESPQRALTEQGTQPDSFPCTRPEGWVAFPFGQCRIGRDKTARVLPPPSLPSQRKNPRQRGSPEFSDSL
jgi:hypothetical protein